MHKSLLSGVLTIQDVPFRPAATASPAKSPHLACPIQVCIFLVFFETESHYTALANLELPPFLSPSPPLLSPLSTPLWLFEIRSCCVPQAGLELNTWLKLASNSPFSCLRSPSTSLLKGIFQQSEKWCIWFGISGIETARRSGLTQVSSIMETGEKGKWDGVVNQGMESEAEAPWRSCDLSEPGEMDLVKRVK